MPSPVALNVKLYGYTKIDFDRKPVRRALMLEAREVRKLARANVSRRAVSGSGEYPGLDTGDLRRSITAFSKGRGFLAIIQTKRTERMKKRKFFPSILIHGRKRAQKAPKKTSISGKNKQIGQLEARKDPILDAFEIRRERIIAAVTTALQESLISR